MAKVLFTAVVADMRGKLAGTVFSKNKAGSYTRTKTTPANPQTTDQSIVRSRLGSLSSQWSGLTIEQRNLWIAAAASRPRTNEFGQTYFLSGQQLYVSLNTNLLTAGEDVISAPLAPQEIPELSIVAVTANPTLPALTAELTAPVPAGFVGVVQATPLLSTGVYNGNSKFRQIGVLASGGTETVVLLGDYSAKFGPLAAGYKLGIAVYLVSTTTGEAGVPSKAYAVVA